jgi:hypothetical protein
MSFFTRLLAVPIAFGRALALSTLLGAALLGTTCLGSPLLAQAVATSPPAVSGTIDAAVETVEQRISNLHDKLMITGNEEAAWMSVAQVMRDNSAAIERLVVAKKAQTPESMTALDDLLTYQAFAQAHVDGLKRLISTFKSLYDSMSDAQKAVADETFRSFGRSDAARRG